ncbi:MAG: Gfo/Idh/MocA family oxidoreductase [Kiritimatiellae bacterium]|nr:Gfo/Idh/MocA family oxidoreductase [Kiritimatiellia bacterium]
MKIGIVGAENSHCAAVASLMNVEKACGSARVVAVWGETKAFAKRAAERAQIPEIVDRPEDMIGKIDGVMVDHRHAKYHIPAVTPFIEAKIPAFVDKPFSYTLREGVALLELAKKKKVPVTSFSSVPEGESFKKDLMQQIRAAGKLAFISAAGPADYKSKYGGISFYGIHMVDALLKCFGPGIETVQVLKGGRGSPDSLAVLRYRDGGPLVSMACAASVKTGWTFKAIGAKGNVDFVPQKSGGSPYLASTRKWLNMMKTGKEPFTAAQILEPIAVLEALDKSIRRGGKPVRVAPIPRI